MVFKIILALALVLFQLGDIFLTEKILRNGGVELNPLIRRYGYWIKIPVTIGAIVAGFLGSPLVLIPPLAIMAGVCVWNYTVVRRIKNAI